MFTRSFAYKYSGVCLPGLLTVPAVVLVLKKVATSSAFHVPLAVAMFDILFGMLVCIRNHRAFSPLRSWKP